LHIIIEPKVFYFGTPVVLISTLNEDGTTNIAPMSSVWWLGDSCMLGMSTRSKTVENLIKNSECVLNLPSPDLVGHVNRLALITGKNPVPEYKKEMGYIYKQDKFTAAGFSSLKSILVEPLRIRECPINLEAKVEKISKFGNDNDYHVSIEVKIIKTHIEEDLLVPGTRNYIDTDKWSPLIMNFCEFHGLGAKLHPSKLANAFAPYLNSSILSN
jgi:flavin reductase (DIM6/NTAB) family NADH-FMN oxidoreductase RutF